VTVAGRGRFDTEVMSLLGGRVFTKSGAEGVFCAALPEAGLGLAVKADDGAGRAAQVMIAALIRRFGGFDEETNARLMRFVSPRLSNWNGAEVGLLRPTGPLA
jgi:L-asparaginase II